MDTRTGWMPVCGAVLLCTLTILSLKAWQGGDLAHDIRCLAGSIATSARSLAPSRIDSFPLNYKAADVAPNNDRLFSATHATQTMNQPVASLGSLPYAIMGEEIGGAQHPIESHYGLDSIGNPIAKQVSFGRLRSESSNTRCTINESIRWLAEVHQFVATQLSLLNEASVAVVAVEPGPNANNEPVTNTIPYETKTGDPGANQQNWIMPKALIADLESLYPNPFTAAWAQSTIQIIRSLEHLDGIADPASQTVFEQLRHQLEQLDFITVQVSTVDVESASQAQGKLATTLRQIRYAIVRRLEVWPVVHKLAGRQVNRIGLVDDRQVGQFLLASRSRMNANNIEQGWSNYLQMEQAAAVFNSLNPKKDDQRKAARSVLSRLFSPSLSIAQKNYLNSAIDQQTIDVLKVGATDLVDMNDFLLRLEKSELYENGAADFQLNDHYQSLLWSDDPEFHELAQKLQTHYRNANFRVSVSEEMLNRMVPQLPETQEPYRDNFMGAQVTGENRISNQIYIDLIPDTHQISMRLETVGKVRSRTTATRSGVVVENEGTSRFRIIKRLAFGQNGIFAYHPETTSQVRQRVVGLRSNMDKIPPLGWVVRKIARNKIEQQAPATNRYAQNQLESKAESRFEEEIEQRLAELETTLTERLLHPLIAMDLEPDPVEISTTADRVNMRYRLAGRDQMASNTARPRAVQSSLMSMQIHESAANNIMSRFEFAGKKFNSEELVQYINRLFQTNFVVDDGKQRKPAEFEFASYDPIRLDFDNNQIMVTVNLKSFKIGNGKRWKKLNLRVTYDPQIEDGFRVKLTQSQEGLRIKGQRFNAGDQIAIGLICEVLFPNQFEIALMPTKLGQQLNIRSLQATQFVVANGWIGLSVDDAPHVASQQRQTRQGINFLNRRRH